MKFMVSSALQLQEFDSEVFRVPFYRLKLFDRSRFRKEIERITRDPQVMADAKIPSSDLAWSFDLLEAGFRKVCTQVEFISSGPPLGRPDGGAVIEDVVTWDDHIVRRHALHFEYDRFSLDPYIKREDIIELYFRWIKNSLSSPVIKIAAIGTNFCSFKVVNESVRIDLMSVLDKRQGMGKRLLQSVLSWAEHNGDKSVLVTTECENAAAWKLYTSQGFRVNEYYSCFHLVKHRFMARSKVGDDEHNREIAETSL